MGRRIKNVFILVLVFTLAILLCGMQTDHSYAKENQERERTIDNGGSQEEVEEPKEPEEPEEPGEPDEPEEPEKPPIKKYQLNNTPPDGNNGYYLLVPEIVITHISERGSTKYIFTDSDGNKTDGLLEKQDSSTTISSELFKDGNNQLFIWMEDEDGNKVDETELYREFYLDTKSPSVELKAPNGLDAWYQKEVCLSVMSDDGSKGSQIESVACYYGKRLIGVSENAHSSFYINAASKQGNGITINIVATDRAGNRSEKAQKIFIDNAPPSLSIQGIQNYMITSKPVEVCYEAYEDNAVSELAAKTVWESVDGKQITLPEDKWDNAAEKYSVRHVLQEDGIYRLSASVKDKAGYSADQNAQVIIDSKNPIIHFVDSVNSKYMREFQWHYPIEEIILDYTSYVYEIRMDGKLYQMGDKLIKEGAHVLKVKAIDAAGNESMAQADFVIDRTAPEIRFIDVENKGTYEEKKSFKVTLANQEDVIEDICINGESQNTSRRSKVYEFKSDGYKDYIVTVKAADKAGNSSESQLSFKVEKKKTIFEKMITPIKESFKTHDNNRKDKETIHRTGLSAVRIGQIAAAVTGTLFAILLGIRKYKNR